MSSNFTGHHHTEATKQKMRLAKLGKPSLRKGTTVSALTKIKMSLSAMGKHLGDKNAKWLGDRVSYRGLHLWVQNHLGKAMMCEKCGVLNKSRYHWANISGEYKRDMADWISLCVSCHKKFDKERRISCLPKSN